MGKKIEFKTDTKGMKWRPKLKRYGCSKNSFDPETFEARSYKWWVYVKKINNKVVFNNYNYSVTTNKHQHEMRRLLNELNIKIDLVVNMHSSLDSFYSRALEPMYTKMIQLEIEMQRKGARPDKNKERKERIKQLKKDIKLARRLGAKFEASEIEALTKSMLEDEARRIETARKEREAVRALMARDKQLKANPSAVNFRL